MRRWIVLLSVVGCFDPQLGDRPFACGPRGECPPGYDCAASVCSRGAAPDARPGTPDARLVDARPGTPDARPGAPDAPGGCTGPPTCDGDELVTCAGVRTTCASGCDPGADPPACWILTPSNIRADTCDAPGTGTLHITSGPHTISTDDCTGAVLGQIRGPDLCVLKYAQIVVDAGAVLSFPGARAPVLVATERMEIDGTIDVSAVGRAGQAGSSADQIEGRGDDVSTVGGGGGGHALRGGDSGESSGGAPIDDLAATPLIPGGWGGGAGCTNPTCSMGVLGGAGGGAVQLVACGDLVLGDHVAIAAGGGGGSGGISQVLGGTGGAGGGAGGAILIQANAIALGAHAVLSADGGGGGGGGGDIGSGEPGADSPNDGGLAEGGFGGDVTGGTGASGNNDARPGMTDVEDFTLMASDVSYGGAGGAAGRVELDTRLDQPLVTASGAIVSPRTVLSVNGVIGRHHR
jgi:hypothetical protein